MLDNERYFVGRTSGKQVTVIDDFVMSSAANQVKQVKIEGANASRLHARHHWRGVRCSSRFGSARCRSGRRWTARWGYHKDVA